MVKKQQFGNLFEELAETREITQRDRRKLGAMENIQGENIGYLYVFKYASANASVGYPLILLVRRKGGKRKFTVSNVRGRGRDYIAGILLSDLGDSEQRTLLEEYAGDNRGKAIPNWGTISKLSEGAYIDHYRCYEFKKAQNMSLVDIDIYLETLSKPKE